MYLFYILFKICEICALVQNWISTSPYRPQLARNRSL